MNHRYKLSHYFEVHIVLTAQQYTDLFSRSVPTNFNSRQVSESYIYINQWMSFISDPRQLETGLFTQYQARYGAQTAININFIPDLLQHIKRQLTSEELIRLEDYHLQNYLMELSISYKEAQNLKALTETILSHIRSSNNFWYRHNNQEQLDEEQQQKHHAIVCYQEDLKVLRQTFANVDNSFPFTPEYNRKTSQICQFQLLHDNAEPYFGTRQPLNHVAYIPHFLMKKMSQINKQISLKQQSQNESLVRIDPNKSQQMVQLISVHQDRNQKKILQQCIIFVLCHKSRKIGTPKHIEKDASEDPQQQAQRLSSESDDDQQIQQKQTIFDEFLRYVQKIPTLPKFPNSRHMQLLTLNLINICKTVLQRLAEPSKSSSNIAVQKKDQWICETKSTALKQIKLDQLLINLLSTTVQKALDQSEIFRICQCFLSIWQRQLKSACTSMRQRQQSTLSFNGWLNTPQQILKVKEAYQNMLDHPQFVQLTKYRAVGSGIPWKEEDYLKFLKGLKEFLNIPTNNKKIASSMGDDYEPNHVKHVKGVYLTVMKQRIDRGQCGGGKRGKSLSKSDFIEKDINNFSMRWFQKAKKIKKRRPKRKRRNSNSEDGEEQPDSQY